MMESLFGGMSAKLRNNAAARPQHKEGSRRQQLHNYTRRTLGMGFIRQAVQVPPGEELVEWMATNTVDFYHSISLLVGIVTDDSQPRLDPGWGFPPGFEYLWVDPGSRKPIKCSGPDYIEHVLSWVESVINDERAFPASGTPPDAYPRDFEKTVKAVFKRLFRVFAILYTHHYQRMDAMGAVAHLNTSFKHFIFFCFEFDLVPPPELEAIDTLVERMRQEFHAQGGGSSSGGKEGDPNNSNNNNALSSNGSSMDVAAAAEADSNSSMAMVQPQPSASIG